MKKNSLLYKLLVVATLFCFANCDDTYDEEEGNIPSASMHYLSVSKSDFGYENSTEHSTDFMLTAINTKWQFSNDYKWFSLSPSSGNETSNISLNLKENNSADTSRVGIFYLQSTEEDWTYSYALSVTQERATPYLSVNENNLSFSGGSSQQQTTVFSNKTWTASATSNWIQLSENLTDGVVTITVSPNSSNTYRKGNVVIAAGSLTEYIYIYQYPAEISVSDESLTFENVASELKMTLSSEADWSTTASSSWIEVNPASGEAGEHVLTVSVAPNQSIDTRTGYIAFYTSNYKKTQIEIVQNGLYLKTNLSVLDYGSEKESKTFEVKSNIAWTVTSAPAWLTLSSYDGTGSMAITATASDNPNTSPRSGEIIIQQEGLDISCSINVRQEGKTFSTETSVLQFPHNASTQALEINSELQWTSWVNVPWVTTDRNTGIGNTQVNVSVEDNNSYNEREGKIVYSVSDKSLDVAICQQAKFFTIESQAFNLTSKGGMVYVTFSTNETWTISAERNCDWITFSTRSGQGNGDVILTVSDNPSVNPRSATIVIESQLEQNFRIPVRQDARYLNVNTQMLSFFANGGTSVVEVSTDGEYKVSSSESWITVDATENTRFKVTAQRHEGDQERRGTIVVELTDLEDGTLSLQIPVVQIGQGASFMKGEYGDDVDWNVTTQHGLTLSVTQFTEDKDWNSNPQTGLTITKTGYTGEQNWNASSNQNASVDKNGFGNDDNWNSSANQSVTVGKEGYGSENDWN